jgi:hypothetical protein
LQNVAHFNILVKYYSLHNTLLNSAWSFNWLFMVTWYWIENSISQECNGIRSIALFVSAIVLYVLFHCTLYVFDKSHPSKCFSYESISLFWYYIKQIMNVSSCNGKNIFIPSFTWWKYSYHCTHKHSLFV